MSGAITAGRSQRSIFQIGSKRMNMKATCENDDAVMARPGNGPRIHVTRIGESAADASDHPGGFGPVKTAFRLLKKELPGRSHFTPKFSGSADFCVGFSSASIRGAIIPRDLMRRSGLENGAKSRGHGEAR